VTTANIGLNRNASCMGRENWKGAHHLLHTRTIHSLHHRSTEHIHPRPQTSSAVGWEVGRNPRPVFFVERSSSRVREPVRTVLPRSVFLALLHLPHRSALPTYSEHSSRHELGPVVVRSPIESLLSWQRRTVVSFRNAVSACFNLVLLSPAFFV
jgi:hypothetical protein